MGGWALGGSHGSCLLKGEAQGLRSECQPALPPKADKNWLCPYQLPVPNLASGKGRHRPSSGTGGPHCVAGW